jgi:hypothetical protein
LKIATRRSNIALSNSVPFHRFPKTTADDRRLPATSRTTVSHAPQLWFSLEHCGRHGLVVFHFLHLAGGEFPRVAIDHDAAGEGRNKKSRNDKKHE